MSLETRCVACMVLSGVGDALGYKNGDWEFNYSGIDIHAQLQDITKSEGISALKIDKEFSRVSDDTIMAIASAKALTRSLSEIEEIGAALAEEYVDCWKRMQGRAPGNLTAQSIRILEQEMMIKKKDWNWKVMQFNSKAGGCGAAMRAHPIGIRFYRKQDLELLVGVAIESGRITHHSPSGYLGAIVAALFTALALRKIEPEKWGFVLMESAIPIAKEYIKRSNRQVELNLANFDYFETKWNAYLKLRNISDGMGPVKFPENYGVEERDEAYKSWSFSGWGGSSGVDAPMIAYDAFLGSKGSWEELCLRGMLHGGDSDSTGAIAAAFYGAYYGFEGVSENNHAYVEFRDELVFLGKSLHSFSEEKQSD
jgi:ADP-ribosylarginine hydrolase